jgi:hypothetical protein
MTDSEVIEIIRRLDSRFSKEGAEAELSSFGEVALYANRDGYMRMAIELMKCAFEETRSEADLNYIFTKDSEFGIDHLASTRDEFDFYKG